MAPLAVVPAATFAHRNSSWKMCVSAMENVEAKLADNVSRNILAPLLSGLPGNLFQDDEAMRSLMQTLGQIRTAFNPGDEVEAPTVERIKLLFCQAWQQLIDTDVEQARKTLINESIRALLGFLAIDDQQGFTW